MLDVDWDAESKRIVAVGEGSSGTFAKVFTWDTGNSAGEMVGHNKRVITVSCKSTRPFRIMTGSEDQRTVFYSGPPYKFDRSNDTHTNFVNMVRFSPDGKYIVSVSSDKKIQQYDGSTGAPTADVVNAHDGTIFAVNYSPDGSKFVTASGDKTLKVWDAASLSAITTIPLSPDPQIGDMQQSVLWVGNNVISLSLNGNLNIFNAADFSAPPQVIQGHQSPISAMYLDRDAATLYTGSIDGVVTSRNLSTGVARKLVGTDKKSVSGSAHSGKVVGIGFNAGSITSVGFDDTARFASIETNAYYSDVPLNGQPVALATSAGVVAVATVKEIAIYQGATKVASLGGLAYTPTSIAMLGQSEVAVGGDNSKTHIYDVSGDSLVAKSTLESRSAISSLAYSPDGNFLAVGTSARVIELYERATWTEKSAGSWCYHTSKVTCLAWSPSGAFLASGSTDENIFIWNTSKLSSKLNFPFSHAGGVTGVDWLNDKFLVSIGNDHVIASWNIPETI